MSARSAGDALNVALQIGFFGLLIWACARFRRRPAIAPDGPPDEPYKVYTRAYDLTLRAREVPAALIADAVNRARGWTLRDPAMWRHKIDAATELYAGIPAVAADPVRTAFAEAKASNWAICLLVDHSGSMRDEPILHAAVAVRWISAVLGDLGASVALLGFSTVNWQGGRPREDWLRDGRPKRPGRLCALLHIVYQRFDAPWADEDWEVMLHPDILRENIDGEAIQWACRMLRERPEPRKLLVVLSDGAPVDDSTLTENGKSYLERHLLSVIGEIGQADDVILAALGIQYDVGRYYRLWRSAKNLEDLPGALSGLIAQCVGQAKGIE